MSAESSSPETPATPSAAPARAATAGKVRWRRFAILMIPSAAVAAVLVGLTATGSIAASISVSGNAFEVTSTQLRGTGFEQFGSIATQANGTQHPVAVSVGIRRISSFGDPGLVTVFGFRPDMTQAKDAELAPSGA